MEGLAATVQARRTEYEAYQRQCDAYHQDPIVENWVETVGDTLRQHRIATVLYFVAKSADFRIEEPRMVLRPETETKVLQVHRQYCEHVLQAYPLVAAAFTTPLTPSALPFTYTLSTDADRHLR